MQSIDDLAALEALYPARPSEAATRKVADHLTPTYARWIEAARFAVLSTVGAGGTDASPRGDEGPVAQVEDARTLLIPDWKGNNRLDTLRNIVTDGRMSVLFMVAGSPNVVRVNGSAILTADDALVARFEVDGKHPKSVIVLTVREVYFQCARAIIRSDIWAGAPAPEDLPSAGDFLHELTDGDIDGSDYDLDWPKRAEKGLW